MNDRPLAFWSMPRADVLAKLETSEAGLSLPVVKQRQKQSAGNTLKKKQKRSSLRLFITQFTSPIILILIFASVLSILLHDHTDAAIILVIVAVSGLLGFFQERGAANAVAKLLALVQIQACVVREGRQVDISVEEVVPGDIVILDAGDVIPGDCLLLESQDLYVDEATLTGETFPVDKGVGVLAEDTALMARSNAVWMGTHVISGDARIVVVHTGRDTEFGKVSDRLAHRPLETEFERGIRRFGYMLMEITLVIVFIIFAVNVLLQRPVMVSLLFSMALAVGLTPQLLPAIISINLSHGARNMAKHKVIVKRLASIENFGSMNVLCSDKTGTLTEGTVKLQSTLDTTGQASEKVLLYAYLNASFESGFTNPIDQAIRDNKILDISRYRKLNEVPYDFIRRRLSILVAEGDQTLMVTKGALASILEVCSRVELPDGSFADLSAVKDDIDKLYTDYSAQGYRTLGLAYKNPDAVAVFNKECETGMIFLGFIVLYDPLKENIREVIARLKQTGVKLKVITGDNHLVAAKLGSDIGLDAAKILTGKELSAISTRALPRRAAETDIFAEVEPNQKEHIILALQKAGYVVGYMGDGINDASALHVADVGISVNTAADVAKEAAEIVLLEKDIGVLAEGVKLGRTTFANTLKYVFMATSANFGNMFSMAGASLLLPFLPLLPKQVLLTNLMTDFPEMNIATDAVDKEMVTVPRRWNIRFIRSYMITFGLVSSIFDYLTFGVLLFILHAKPAEFRTGWFVESVVSASLIVLVIRTRRFFIRSKPGKALLIATVSVVAATLLLPFTPVVGLMGFVALPLKFMAYLLVIIVLYVGTTELAKHFFYKLVKD
jgi:P-type Mg2+ transporter